ncbi:ribonuclease H-like domain-containing protein, partial [Candidatus Woesearchaeota archaeon]|nr:ribonuclease H-like domain-containing protein [Candidatus Woesearchaeota archaeon]
MKFQFFPIDITYKIVDGKPIIYLFGKTTDGKQICVLDDSFTPYFYVIPKQGAVIKDRLLSLSGEENQDSYKITKVESDKMKFKEKEIDALRVYTNIPKAVPFMKDVIREWDDIESVHEYDILFTRRYLIDKNISPLVLTNVEGEIVPEKLKVPAIKAKKIEQSSNETIKEPKILAFDIETYGTVGTRIMPEKDPILMIAVYGDNFKRILTWKKFKTDEKNMEILPSEADIIQRFQELIDEYQPDIIAGYFSDGFDFPYLKTRAKKYKLNLELGLDYSEINIGRGASKSAQIHGIFHFDVFKFVKRAVRKTLKTDVFTLDAVSEEVLGEKKIKVDLSKLSEAWDSNSDELDVYAKYNLHDARLAYKLCENLLPNLF